MEFSVTRRDAGDGAPGATAAFPYDRTTVERFRAAFPRARWRDDLRAWFVPGTRAERRLTAWMGREWPGVLAHADQRGRDAFAFEPIASPYLEVAGGFVVRTPYSRAVIAELRAVPWARWDPALKAWRVPFRSFEELSRRWPAIEDAARRAEPGERRKREEGRKASPGHADRRAQAAERRRERAPGAEGGAMGRVDPGLEGGADAVRVVGGRDPARARHRGCRPPGRARGAAEAGGGPQGRAWARGQAGRGRRAPPEAVPRAGGRAAAA